ncbi:SDR family oxidoreductase [Compostimonas suwonensis]|uniref:Short-subunit dehydrogenase involved in D-alanine esterification of teichoic acids n=1 Tax=Compostimonas suwonensis TaxID=1048394 RepID=A0A2M9C0I2_9MICO|nr:SDR family NAD(P)-dependent oxidoreductase [Compostimonas suwonensis]PJJ63843.1 short-subunit dehydrogenase involved in D-alanine esterification of teichoic acids [Compostimonas suwonensis]
MDISTRTIFIPGATSGIGLALALRLKEAGSTVIIGGRRTHLLEQLATEHGLHTVRIDTADPASILTARDQVLAQHPELDTVIAMAGIMTVEDVHTAAFLTAAEDTVVTNVLGPIRLIAAFIEHLQTRPDAAIITVSSGLAHTPLAISPSYNGSKAFIHRFTETIRLQLAGSSVEVVELVPPGVRTELTPGQTEFEAFLPLDAFIDEVITLLQEQSDAKEILVDAVKGMRFAEVNGSYDQMVAAINPGL